RYNVNGSYVSPMALPGTPNGQYTATGLEHNELGEPAYTAENHIKMSEKRWRKYDGLKQDRSFVRHFGPEKAKLGILCWGTTAGPARGAVYMAQQEGLPVSMLQVQLLSPLPEAAIAEYINSVDMVLVPEVNYQGQFARLIQGTFGVKVHSFTQYDGMPFRRLDILKKAHELLGVEEPALV
nr:2-oxoacid:acceptor oxidoreductase subunit alpha [Chloroflexaceae bacterium]